MEYATVSSIVNSSFSQTGISYFFNVSPYFFKLLNVDGIDDFKYSAIKDDRDADKRLMDDEPETDDTDDNIDVKRAEAVIEDQLKSNQDFVESLGE